MNEFGDVAGGATAPTNDFAGAIKEAVDPTKELEDSIKNLNDRMHALIDPLFGAEDALRKNEDAQADVVQKQLAYVVAQKKVTTAVKEHGRKSDEATAAILELFAAQGDLNDANRDVVRSAEDVTTATNELKLKMDAGEISVGKAKAQLDLWVQQGLITEDQAKATADKLGLVAEKAAELNGQNVNVSVSTNIDSVIEQFRQAAAVISEFNSSHGTSIGVYRGQGLLPSPAPARIWRPVAPCPAPAVPRSTRPCTAASMC